MIIIIFVLFILYTLACIADGPDIKPVLKFKIGNYLRNKADSLFYVKRCTPSYCSFVRHYLDKEAYNALCDVNHINYDTELIKHTVRINEETVYYYNKGASAINIIDEAKHICRTAILKEVGRRINYDVNDNNPDFCIYITGSIIVNKNERRTKKDLTLFGV